jgi:hypothetical protein
MKPPTDTTIVTMAVVSEIFASRLPLTQAVCHREPGNATASGLLRATKSAHWDAVYTDKE